MHDSISCTAFITIVLKVVFVCLLHVHPQSTQLLFLSCKFDHVQHQQMFCPEGCVLKNSFTRFHQISPHYQRISAKRCIISQNASPFFTHSHTRYCLQWKRSIHLPQNIYLTEQICFYRTSRTASDCVQFLSCIFMLLLTMTYILLKQNSLLTCFLVEVQRIQQ